MTTKTPHVHAGNSASTKVPHPHAELIKAWADGKQIQYWSNLCEEWFDCPDNNCPWHPKAKYRVKPEPKPDVVMYGNVDTNPVTHQPMLCRDGVHNIMFVFDGETGKLKDCQVLAHE